MRRYGGRAYWAMAVLAAVGLVASLVLRRRPCGARCWSAPQLRRRAGARARPRSARPASRSRASSSGPSRSTQSAPCASSMAGAMASEVDTMQPTMILKPRARASRGQRQRLGEAAGLVELDVDGVVAPGERGEAGAVVQRFIGAHRHRARAGERRIGARGQRLLDQLDAGLGGDGHERGQQLRRPGLVGVGDRGAPAGHAARTWRRRAASPAPPSLSFRRGMVRAAAAAALRPWPRRCRG